uniref:Peptidase M15C domain-containing protein n=1 Tax=Ciona savignyi TaxID=51511 RepID=H2ZDV9_CIOSA
MLSYLVLFIGLLVHGVASSDYACTSQGGSCVDYRYFVCNGGVETGLCDGDSNRRCCLKCDTTCVSNSENWASCCDSACTSSGGTCKDNSNYCSGRYSSGKCGGPSERQCCSSSTSSGSCNLVTYSTANVYGYNGLTVQVEPGFKSNMVDINSFAISCGVEVVVTHAFREEGQDLGGTVVPPASNSNHLVGHAIDMNLDTPSGFCNSDCLYAKYNSYANCFLNKVTSSGLRWGGDFYSPDPVHIDDGLNLSSPSQWDSLYYDLQANCY